MEVNERKEEEDLKSLRQGGQTEVCQYCSGAEGGFDQVEACISGSLLLVSSTGVEQGCRALRRLKTRLQLHGLLILSTAMYGDSMESEF